MNFISRKLVYIYLAIFLIIATLLADSPFFFVVLGIFVFLQLIVYDLYLINRFRRRFFKSFVGFICIVAVLSFLLVLQLNFSYEEIFTGQPLWLMGLKKIVNLCFISLSFLANHVYVNFHQYEESRENNVVSFAQIKKAATALTGKLGNKNSRVSFSDLRKVLLDLPRHSSRKYVNIETLSQEYFGEVEKCMDEPNVYIVLSNTGTPASNLISSVTKKDYNHVSISFDSDLNTVVSYNGGAKIHSPGLNPEMIESFNKKEDASILVYRLEVNKEQKRKMVDKIKDINKNGSAYNILGLVVKTSLKPNIMICSQFVYTLLEEGGVEYFKMKPNNVRPLDFIEQDYKRKLHFCYEFHFNSKGE